MTVYMGKPDGSWAKIGEADPIQPGVEYRLSHRVMGGPHHRTRDDRFLEAVLKVKIPPLTMTRLMRLINGYPDPTRQLAKMRQWSRRKGRKK